MAKQSGIEVKRRGRPRIHPPKIPKNEAAQVTIAMQQKQIEMLLDRCETLLREKDIAEGRAEMMGHMTQELCQTQDAYKRLLGWQDAMRELIAGGTNPFTSSSTLGG
jgi:hypothetical protein